MNMSIVCNNMPVGYRPSLYGSSGSRSGRSRSYYCRIRECCPRLPFKLCSILSSLGILIIIPCRRTAPLAICMHATRDVDAMLGFRSVGRLAARSMNNPPNRSILFNLANRHNLSIMCWTCSLYGTSMHALLCGAHGSHSRLNRTIYI